MEEIRDIPPSADWSRNLLLFQMREVYQNVDKFFVGTILLFFLFFYRD
jgi:hypothetical protein